MLDRAQYWMDVQNHFGDNLCTESIQRETAMIGYVTLGTNDLPRAAKAFTRGIFEI